MHARFNLLELTLARQQLLSLLVNLTLHLDFNLLKLLLFAAELFLLETDGL